MKSRSTCECCGFRYYVGDTAGYWGQQMCPECYDAECFPSLDGCLNVGETQYADVEYSEVAKGGWKEEWYGKIGKPLQSGDTSKRTGMEHQG